MKIFRIADEETGLFLRLDPKYDYTWEPEETGYLWTTREHALEAIKHFGSALSPSVRLLEYRLVEMYREDIPEK